jgi:hypothetical protein
VAPPVEALAAVRENGEKQSPVPVGTVDVLTSIAPRGDVVEGIWELESEGP